jgi:hypothetical protein
VNDRPAAHAHQAVFGTHRCFLTGSDNARKDHRTGTDDCAGANLDSFIEPILPDGSPTL